MADKSENSFDDELVSEIRQLPNVWLKKIITAIFVWDLDKDGHTGYDDIMDVADKVINIGNLNGKSADDVIECFRDLASHTSDNPPTEVFRVTSLSEQLVAVWRTKDNPSLRESRGKIYSRMFQAIDFNANGFLTFDKYLVFWNAFKLDRRFARMQFDFMDTDQDGKISDEEFLKAHVDYIENTNDGTLNRFFGPLINY
ncbi:unnamed protein product [Owenia fusiformis]|uniref:Uncharacterized protein n=1 Tax=Owenia fusiformis TaxID=6347 RepID=A0A8J1US62_OWEFU|nr:unnamed protein product [Owenia fusiformis]